ncbi:hypothetical protein TNCV_3507841 [Trichonephila clavipes]|uniref:Uncharacterized protein n=1 Tax=Trichonephila clavipes TaxID=2585209 RepID=A0A8X6VCZ3_TRICX|nr:hypothetical protein TNCV_3507841 [Trichonephila clavipes]
MNNSVREGDAPPFFKTSFNLCRGAHAYAYSSAVSFPNVSVLNVIENSSYDLPYVKNSNTRNDSNSLIKDYKYSPLVSMEIPLRTAYGQTGRCGMQPKPKPSSLRAQAHQRYSSGAGISFKSGTIWLEYRSLQDEETRGRLDMDHQNLKAVILKLGGVLKVSDHGRHVMISSPVPLKTCRVGERCTLNLSRAQRSSRWSGVVVRRGGGASSGVNLVT